MGTRKGTKPRKWSKEEKLKLVLLHLNEKVSLMQIEKEYSVSNGLVSTWVKKYLNGGEEALVSRSGNPSTPKGCFLFYGGEEENPPGEIAPAGAFRSATATCGGT